MQINILHDQCESSSGTISFSLGVPCCTAGRRVEAPASAQIPPLPHLPTAMPGMQPETGWNTWRALLVKQAIRVYRRSL